MMKINLYKKTYTLHLRQFYSIEMLHQISIYFRNRKLISAFQIIMENADGDVETKTNFVQVIR